MKEKIYTIPVTDAFKTPCECPMCILHKKLEDENIEYILGPFLMEPEGRIQTNGQGFCKKHFEQLYNSQINRLGLGLIVDTHLNEQNKKFKDFYTKKADLLKKDAEMSILKNMSSKLSSKQSDGGKVIEDLIENLQALEDSCTICSRLEYTMDRYVDVILYLFFKEQEFKEMFNNQKGFCMVHFKTLVSAAKKYLSSKEAAIFVKNLMEIQIKNMERINEEVNWFTKKFDYRNNDAPWGNSKDALLRSIQKLVGFCDLK